MPTGSFASTHHRKLAEVPNGTKIKGHVLAGYKPEPVLMVERKLYQIHAMSLQGWRRTGQLAVEVDGWRAHEAEWFGAMEGMELTVSDPGYPHTHNEDSQFLVHETSFERKHVVLVDDDADSETQLQLHEGVLNFKETWKSAWRRHWAEIVGSWLQLVLLPLMVAIGAGITLLWVSQSSPNPKEPGNGAAVEKESLQPDQSAEPTITKPKAELAPTDEVATSPTNGTNVGSTQNIGNANEASSLDRSTDQPTPL